MSNATQTRLPAMTIVRVLQKHIMRLVIGLALAWWALPLFMNDLLVRNAVSVTCEHEIRFQRSLSGNYSVTNAGALDGCIEHATFYNVSAIIVLVCSIFLTIFIISYEASELSNTSDALVNRHLDRTTRAIDNTLGDYAYYIVAVAVILGVSLLFVLVSSIFTMAFNS